MNWRDWTNERIFGGTLPDVPRHTNPNTITYEIRFNELKPSEGDVNGHSIPDYDVMYARFRATEYPGAEIKARFERRGTSRKYRNTINWLVPFNENEMKPSPDVRVIIID